jgi:mitochondrial-processing peptidase subunit beta
MLVAKEPASFTGSEVCFAIFTGHLSVLLILIFSFYVSQ